MNKFIASMALLAVLINTVLVAAGQPFDHAVWFAYALMISQSVIEDRDLEIDDLYAVNARIDARLQAYRKAERNTPNPNTAEGFDEVPDADLKGGA